MKTCVFCFGWRHMFALRVLLCNTQYIYVIDSDMQIKSTHRMRCCISATTLVTRTRHSVTLYVHSQSCYLICSFILPMAVQGTGKSRANIAWDTTGWRPSSKTASLADPLLASLLIRPIIRGTQKENTDFPALCTAQDSCCRISCGVDCLLVDCAEQFGELCQESVSTESATECKDELCMLHWFRTYGLCCYIVGCSDSPGRDKGIHNQWTVERVSCQDTRSSGSDTCERFSQNNIRDTLLYPTRQEGKSDLVE